MKRKCLFRNEKNIKNIHEQISLQINKHSEKAYTIFGKFWETDQVKSMKISAVVWRVCPLICVSCVTSYLCVIVVLISVYHVCPHICVSCVPLYLCVLCAFAFVYHVCPRICVLRVLSYLCVMCVLISFCYVCPHIYVSSVSSYGCVICARIFVFPCAFISTQYSSQIYHSI